MRCLLLRCAAALVFGLASAPMASAFDIQVEDVTNADGSPRFTDPDEQFAALAGGETGRPVFIFRNPAAHRAASDKRPVETERGAGWTAERIRLVFGPDAH